MVKQTRNLVGLAGLMAVIIIWLDITQHDIETVVVTVAAAAFILSYAHPNRAWVWAILMGSSSLVGLTLAGWVGLISPYPLMANLLPTVNLLIPAFLAAYLAVMVNMSLAEEKSKKLIESKGNV
ncbi:MAG: hypothetical protein KJ063_15015 [Anaerolineae bacterium]|nr:hypothetical protein [Anaerolineae bacterium]